MFTVSPEYSHWLLPLGQSTSSEFRRLLELLGSCQKAFRIPHKQSSLLSKQMVPVLFLVLWSSYPSYKGLWYSRHNWKFGLKRKQTSHSGFAICLQIAEFYPTIIFLVCKIGIKSILTCFILPIPMTCKVSFLLFFNSIFNLFNTFLLNIHLCAKHY